MHHPFRWLLTAAGTSASLALAPSAIAQEPTQPLIKPNVCVERLQTGSGSRDGGLQAHFWYERFGGEALDIPLGPHNQLTPEGTAIVPFATHETVPTHFEVEGRFAFAVDLVGTEPVAWTLRDPASGEGGTAAANEGYAGRCLHFGFTTAPDPDASLPFGSAVRLAWTAEVSGIGEFLDADAPPVPWSAWRSFHGNPDEPKCSLDGAAVACQDADVTLTDLAPGQHVFRVFAQPPLPGDVGSKAGSTTHDGLFEMRAHFTVAAPEKPPVDEPKPPVDEPKPPVEEPKPPVMDPKPPVDEPKPPVDPQPPVQPQPPLNPQPPVQPQPKACVKRSATFTVPGVKGQRYRSVKVTVNGKRVAVRRVKGRLVATVAPSRLAGTTSSVTVTIRFMSGKQRTFVRNVRTCF